MLLLAGSLTFHRSRVNFYNVIGQFAVDLNSEGGRRAGFWSSNAVGLGFYHLIGQFALASRKVILIARNLFG